MGWKIKTIADKCIRCNVHFPNEALVHSIIQYGEEGPFRIDFCDTCWSNDGYKRDRFSYWQVSYIKKEDFLEQKPKIESYINIIEEKIKSEKYNDRLIVYFISLIMERRKRFIMRPSSNSEENVYEDKENGKIYIISEPAVNTSELLKMSQKITKIIEELVTTRSQGR